MFSTIIYFCAGKNEKSPCPIRTEALALVEYGLQTKMHYNKTVIMITFLGISYSKIALLCLSNESM